VSDSRVHALLLTGSSGVGKTTVIRSIADALVGHRIRGFLTEEIRTGGRREGFRLETFDGHVAVLAHMDIRSPHRVGKYGVDVAALDRVVDASLQPDEHAHVYLIDEIGRMECYSSRFTEAVARLLDSGLPVVATIHRRAGGFVREVKGRPDVELWEVTRENRETMVGWVLEWIGDR
jgi:nucleoside-triphosphatase